MSIDRRNREKWGQKRDSLGFPNGKEGIDSNPRFPYALTMTARIAKQGRDIIKECRFVEVCLSRFEVIGEKTYLLGIKPEELIIRWLPRRGAFLYGSEAHEVPS
jgi:hypothetical protein